MNIVITGTSRGIGLELTRQALEKGHQVLAIARDVQKTSALQELKTAFSKQLQLASVDLAHPELKEKIEAAASSFDSIDVLINNAGIYRQTESLDDFMESFRVNSVVPLQVTRALQPRLKKARQPKVIQITSLMGSIADNQSGGSTAYRASKTALNMITKSLAIEEKWLTLAVIHPGWVQTDMGGKEAPTSVTESATGIWKVIEGLKPAQSGSFYDFEGDLLPW